MSNKTYTLKDLDLHKETVITWIQSCYRDEQISLAARIAQQFIFDRFKDLVPLPEYAEAVGHIVDALDAQRKLVTQSKDIYANNVPTLDCYDYDRQN